MTTKEIADNMSSEAGQNGVPTNSLIVVSEINGKQSVNARDLHAALESKSAFNDWIARRIESYGFKDGQDFYSFLSESTGGRPAVEYALSVPMAKELAMVENNTKGREVRQYLIQLEKAWNTPELVFARALQAANTLIPDQVRRIAELKPKAEFFDQVASSKTAVSMRQVAAALNIPGWGRNKLFAFLRDQKILGQDNLPYREFQDMGFFRVIEQKWSRGGEVHVSFTTLVYQRGVDYIRKLIARLERVAVRQAGKRLQYLVRCHRPRILRQVRRIRDPTVSRQTRFIPSLCEQLSSGQLFDGPLKAHP